ncbi:Maf family nucleotide pyrophosphatase [Spongiimicrobium salis]|uniref:Maf family nucleotide pyrophosphatase n=1 Tax=Spongiimicrobium salis TaxID=1667022 RepID=UPI00374D6258
MLENILEHYHVILASGSPRRQQFFKELGIPFEVRLKPIDEIYPPNLKAHEISDYLALLKANAFKAELKDKDILITSDTVVWHKGHSLAKPMNSEEAHRMLRTLSNDWHAVITSVCFSTSTMQKVVHQSTRVKFKALSDEEIRFYIDTYSPYDKAGGYGIQDWIGLIGIEEIQGTYSNVVGLPTNLVYKTLIAMVS